MIKHLLLLFSLVGLFFYQFFLQSNVTVTQTAPPTASANSSFVVQVTIDKGAVSGFAKFQEDLPQGFTAEAVDKHGATVLSSGNAIKFIWASLPSDQSITISFKVTVDGTVSGAQTFGGKFLYVINNQKQEADAAPSTVTVSGGAVAANNTTQPNNTSTANNTTQPNNTTTTTGNNNSTTQPNNTTTGNNTTTQPNTTTTTANNTTQPNNTTTTGNNTTTQPNNTTTTANNTTQPNNTTTTGNNTTTQPTNTNTTSNNTTSAPAPYVNGVSVSRSFSSSSVSPGSDIIVSVTVHKGTLSGFAKLEEVIPAGITAAEGDKQSASFTFVDNKVKMVWLSLPADSVFTVTYKFTTGASMSGDQSISGTFSYVFNGAATKYPIPSSSFTVGGAAVVNNNNNNQVNSNQSNNNQVVNNNQSNNNQNNNNQTNNNQTSNITPHVTGDQGGVMYRVQVMALQHAVSVAYFVKHFSLKDKIYTEMLDGFTKYTTGKFSDYKSVHDRREEIKGMGIIGPFVVAYNGGKRITVQEALMITKQQWYQ
jgi:hypothetical protein